MKYIILITFLLLGCGSNTTTNTSTPLTNDDNGSSNSPIIDNNESNNSPITDTNTSHNPRETIRADVVEVTVGGNEGSYTFSVSVKSSDTGCEQYADWWEVLRDDGTLVYRRVLGHPHVAEEPFTRNGVSIDIQKDTIIYIRAHMNNKGYVGDVFKGSVESGFSVVSTVPTFDAAIELEDPQPPEC